MIKYRLICPRCGASIVAVFREEVMWEFCPGCLRHVWDLLDARMAEPVSERQSSRQMHAGQHKLVLH